MRLAEKILNESNSFLGAFSKLNKLVSEGIVSSDKVSLNEFESLANKAIKETNWLYNKKGDEIKTKLREIEEKIKGIEGNLDNSNLVMEGMSGYIFDELEKKKESLIESELLLRDKFKNLITELKNCESSSKEFLNE